MYAFCPLCLQEMIFRARTVRIRSEWALVFQTHCPRHRAPLIERCAVCFVEDPILPNANAFSPIPSCWKCGSALFSYDADERASSIVAEIISLESAILELVTGSPPNRTWARLSPDPAFVEKLRILIEDLTTPTDDRVPPFLRIFDADQQWRRYLFGRQRPETRSPGRLSMLAAHGEEPGILKRGEKGQLRSRQGPISGGSLEASPVSHYLDR